MRSNKVPLIHFLFNFPASFIQLDLIISNIINQNMFKDQIESSNIRIIIGFYYHSVS
jgi:hypothetical protein